MNTPVLSDLAGRFVGGDDLPAGLTVVRGLNARGIKASLNSHGMHAREPAEAIHAADEAIEALHRIREEGIDSHVSVKLTKIGLDVGLTFCLGQLGRILDAAASTGGFVRIDMEESTYLDQTLRTFEEMQDRYGDATVGLVVQSYLRFRSADLDRLMARGARVRLVKGGCREPAQVAFQSEAEIDAAFMRDIGRLLRSGNTPAIATHDAAAIAWTKRWQAQLGLGSDAFEFQMLHGVKPEIQEALIGEGYTVRAYVPYGGDWPAHMVSCLRQIMPGSRGPTHHHAN